MALLRFVEPTKGYDATVSITCSTSGFDFSTTLPPGTYAVRIFLGTFARQAKVNLLPVNYLAVSRLKVP